MKAFIITLLILLSTVSFSYSQNYQIGQSLDLFRQSKMQSGDWSKMLTESDIEGSPYLNDEFINGTMFTTSKVQYNDIPLRYNIYNDNLEFKQPDGQVMAMAAPEIIEKVEISDDILAYIPYSNAKKIRRGFFRLVEEGNASLYARPLIIYTDPVEPAAYSDAQPAKFTRKPDTYYIRIGMEQAKLISSKKELLAAFPNHDDEVAAFVKKNKVKPTKPEKLQELVKFYNSL